VRLLIALTVAAAALRFATLDFQSFWFDEAVTVGLVRMDLWGMLEEIPRSESTPPLYYLLAWLWTQLFGTGETGIRSLSALLGTAAVPAFYLAARELTGRDRVALAVAALAAFNPLLVWYSQEARSYALLTLLGALALYFFARLLRRFDARALAGWAVTSILALTSHYFAVFLVVPQAVWLLARRPRRRAAVLAVGAVAAVGAALLPLVVEQGSLEKASFIRSTALPYRLVRSAKQYLVGFDAPFEMGLSVVAGAIAAAGIVVALRRSPPSGVVAAAALGALGVGIPFALALADVDYFDTRNLIASWLPLATVACAGLATRRPGVLGVAAICAIGLASTVAVALEPRWQRRDWRGAAEALRAPEHSRAVVLSPGEGSVVPFRLYEPGARIFPVEGALVREIALVSTYDDREADEVHPHPPPRPASPPVPERFTEVRRRYEKGYTMILYASTGPVFLKPEALVHFRLLQNRNSAVLLEPPVRRGAAGARRPHAG
jgi:mannosyltransferase